MKELIQADKFKKYDAKHNMATNQNKTRISLLFFNDISILLQ